MEDSAAKTATACPRFQFSLQRMLVLTFLVAVVVASTFQYYRVAMDTVDGVRTPLRNIRGAAIPFASLALGSFVFLIGHLFLRLRTAVVIAVLALLLIPALRTWYPAPLELVDLYRPRGAQAAAAELHNAAASVTAIAITSYVERQHAWPGSWDDLQADIAAAVKTPIALPTTAVPGVSGAAGPAFRAASGMRASALPELVDVDFTADLKALAIQDWLNFTGIRPHQPAYNFYRVQFQELIDRIAAVVYLDAAKIAQ